MISFLNLDKEKILTAAKQQFPHAYIEQDDVDFYLPDIEKGEMQIMSVTYPVYVSTHYAYEDKMVNGNKTRYKIPLSIIYTKQDAYEIIYDSRDICYVAYEQENAIQFVPISRIIIRKKWLQFLYDFIKDQITICEKK